MKRYSLYNVTIGILLFLIIIYSASIYFSVTKHREDLIKTTIEEKTHLAEVIDEIMTSPLWIYRLALVPGMEKAFIKEMTEFEDVKYIRIVTSDGTIYKSSIREEWGNIIKDPDISKVLESGKKIVKDQVFEGEKIKLIIYPGHQDKTIWVAFTLDRVEDEIRSMLIRDTSFMLAGLLVMILILFLVSKEVIVDPLKKATEACEEIRKGNLDVRIETKSKTEIGELADTFNEMVKDLKKSHTALEDKIKELEEYIAVTSHDLQQPLATIQAYTMLLRGSKLSKDSLKNVEIIESQTNFMRDLLNDLLEYSRMKEKIPFKELKTEEILKEVRKTLSIQIEKYNARIKLKDIPDRIIGQEKGISRLFRNLLDNALKYTNKRPVIEIGCRDEKDNYLFWVKDNGIGIEKKYHEKIFKTFWKLGDKPGTGMGLAICKTIVENHGGRIWVDSEPGKGSTFYFTIPKGLDSKV